MMDVWIVFSLAAVAIVFAGSWIHERLLLRKARRELAALDHTPPFEGTNP